MLSIPKSFVCSRKYFDSAPKLKLIPTLFVLFLFGCEDPEPRQLTDCNNTYNVVYPGATVERVMNGSNYVSQCLRGGAEECIRFQQCVSTLKHHESENPQEVFVELDYMGTITFIKQKLIENQRRTISEEHCIGGRCSKRAPNIERACDRVVSTYSEVAVGNSIFMNIPELGYEESQTLGVQAVTGYGDCMCVLHNSLRIEDDMSIGYCMEDQYIECDTAFCGRNISR